MDIDAGIEEMEMLKNLNETYAVKIKRLAQQAQWQDSQLQTLRQSAKQKTTEIDEAQAEIDQLEAERRQLVRQRQQREADVAKARQQLAQTTAELRRLLNLQERDGVLPDTSNPDAPGRRRVIDVTPGSRPRLAPGAAPGADDDSGSSSA